MRSRNIGRAFSERVTPHAILPEPDQPVSGYAAVVNVARNNYSVESGIPNETARMRLAGPKSGRNSGVSRTPSIT
jgi:hypothetical protein